MIAWSDCTNGLKTYWTETGNGADPEAGLDIVGGNIVVEVAPGAGTFTVRHNDSTEESYAVKGGGVPPVPTDPTPGNPTQQFAWSTNSGMYHLATCDFVSNINSKNLRRGDAPPDGKVLHKNCPLHRQ